MHSQADHLHLSLELNLTTGSIAILEPLNSDQCAIRQLPAVHIAKPALAQDVLPTEAVSCNLELPEAEPLHISQAYLWCMLLYKL